MDISIKELDVEMQIKNNGIALAVYDGKKYLGSLVINKTRLIWCKGKTARENGIPVKWKEFINSMEEE